MKEDINKLKKLKEILEIIPNNYPDADFPVSFETSELTALCPFTKHPDFYTLIITYKPDKLLVELKSLKLYIEKFRDLRTTHETILNVIFEDFKSILLPKYLRIELKVNIRGGIKTTLHREEGE